MRSQILRATRQIASGSGSIPRGPSGPPSDFLDLVADFGGSFANWNAYVSDVAQAGQTINLTIPAGTFRFGSLDGISTAQELAKQYGAGQQINMYGAGIGVTILEAPYFPIKWNLDAYVHPALGGPQPRIASANAGDTTITLLDPTGLGQGGSTFISNFTVGNYTQITGVDTQADGYPANPVWWEFKKVTAVDTMAGVVTLDSPLAYTYKSYWPQFVNTSGGSGQDTGGPATAIGMTTHWDVDMYITDCTIDAHGGWYGNVRTEHFNNISFTDEPAIASICMSSRYTNCDFHRLIEIDKGTDYLEYTNCSFSLLQTQSRSCAKRLVINGGTVGAIGLPWTGEFNDCDIAHFQAVLPGYGYSDSAVFTNCSVDPSTESNFQATFPANYLGASFFDFYDPVTGLFTMPAEDYLYTFGAQRGFVPGATAGIILYNSGQGFNTIGGPFFRVLDVVKTGPFLDLSYDVVISTDLHLSPHQDRVAVAAGICIHPCPDWTVINGTGLLSPYSNAHGYGRPVGSYYYSGVLNDFPSVGYRPGSGAGQVSPSVDMAGFISSIEIIVTKAYTGVLASLRGGVGPTNGNVIDDALAGMTYQPMVDLKTVGTRTITPGSTVGAQVNDLGLDLGTDWFATWSWRVGVAASSEANLDIFLAEDPSVWPEFSVEIFTDHEI